MSTGSIASHRERRRLSGVAGSDYCVSATGRGTGATGFTARVLPHRDRQRPHAVRRRSIGGRGVALGHDGSKRQGHSRDGAAHRRRMDKGAAWCDRADRGREPAHGAGPTCGAAWREVRNARRRARACRDGGLDCEGPGRVAQARQSAARGRARGASGDRRARMRTRSSRSASRSSARVKGATRNTGIRTRRFHRCQDPRGTHRQVICELPTTRSRAGP